MFTRSAMMVSCAACRMRARGRLLGRRRGVAAWEAWDPRRMRNVPRATVNCGGATVGGRGRGVSAFVSAISGLARLGIGVTEASAAVPCATRGRRRPYAVPAAAGWAAPWHSGRADHPFWLSASQSRPVSVRRYRRAFGARRVGVRLARAPEPAVAVRSRPALAARRPPPRPSPTRDAHNHHQGICGPSAGPSPIRPTRPCRRCQPRADTHGLEPTHDPRSA